MTNNDMLKNVTAKGIDVATKEWTTREQIIADAIYGMIQSVPAEAMVDVNSKEGDGESRLIVSITGVIDMNVGIRCSDTEMFNFLIEMGNQKAYDVDTVLGEVNTKYRDSTVRGRR